MKLVTIGTVYVDIKGYPHGAFSPTGRNAGEVAYFHGGVARNIAEDIANLGEESIFIGLLDKSGAALDVLKHLQDCHIDTEYVRITEDGMGTWLAVFDDKGDLCASISKRPNLLPIRNILEEYGDDIFTKADSILLEMDINEPVVAKAMELAKKYNKPVYGVISNMTIGMERWSYITQTNCFICNREEAGIVFNKPTMELNPKEILELMQNEMASKNLKCMIVTLDKEGSAFLKLNAEAGICSPLTVNVVDTTGAGDAFFAGVSVGLTRGQNLEEACQLGTKAAANVITKKENVCDKIQ